MTIIEYILDPQDKPRSFNPKTIPSYVSDGGAWMNPDGSEKMIGIGVEGSIPEGIKTYTLAELQARQRAIHAVYPLRIGPDPDGGEKVYMTDEQVDATIKLWVDERS
jgi:hypothetical protein